MPAPFPRPTVAPVAVAALAAALALAGSPRSAGAEPPPPGTVESLQRQVDELREGQRRMLEEIASLRRQLQDASARAEIAAKPAPPSFHTLNVRGEPIRGGTNARVAIVQFSDFNCSHCAAFEREALPRLRERYLAPGTVRFLFRDLPDRSDADALAKSEAARCAGEQGRFWEMHDRLFADPRPFEGDVAKGHLAALGLDAARFDACMGSRRYRGAIQGSAAQAGRMGIHGTPAFLVGVVDAGGDVIRSREILTGAESASRLEALLDGLIAETAAAAKATDAPKATGANP